MEIVGYAGATPRFGQRVFVAPGAVVVGDVELEDDVSLWFGTVLRGDIHHIRVGARSNLQDGVLVHVEHGQFPTVVEEEVTVGHGAVLHGCTVRRGALVGIGAKVLNGAVVGERALVAAGAVVREGFEVPPGTLAAGVPATVRRELTAGELARLDASWRHYLEYKSRYLAEGIGAVEASP